MGGLLIVVDYQRDFVDGSLGFPGAEALDGPIAARIAQRRREGWALYGETGASRLPGDPVFEKETFPSLALAQWLQGRAYGEVELCGLVSNICVLSNAVMVKAALPDAEIRVDARLTASADPALHEKALDVLEGIHVTVTGREG